MIVTDLKILRKRSAPFTGSKNEYKALIEKLGKELANSKIPGCGLSAIQIGIPLKVAIIRTKNLTLNLCNAEIIAQFDPIRFRQEGCLSIPNVFEDTTRFNIITLKNQDWPNLTLMGTDAIVAQHEIDHFNGIIFTDRVI